MQYRNDMIELVCMFSLWNSFGTKYKHLKFCANRNTKKHNSEA